MECVWLIRKILMRRIIERRVRIQTKISSIVVKWKSTLNVGWFSLLLLSFHSSLPINQN